MIFGISDEDFKNKNILKILDGCAGSGKSTQAVSELKRIGSNFCLASFSNALKFAAADRFGCNVDTICGLEFINNPYPRSAEKDVTEFDTVVNDEILLDGIECINWMKHNIGKVNIIALTDSKQMLSAENSSQVLKAFTKLCKSKNVIYVNITETKRARNDETKQMYEQLYNLESDMLYSVNRCKEIFGCDIINFEDVEFSDSNAYICHSNIIEHEVYKSYDISSRRDITLIPKNQIARSQKVDLSRYPICDQITATDKKIAAYCQASAIATPTRYQGREIEVGDQLYFIVEEDSVLTGREIYTVGTRVQDKKSIHIAIIKVSTYEDPKSIGGIPVVKVKRLDIPDHDKKFKQINNIEMAKLVKENGDPNSFYLNDFVSSGDNIIYSTNNESSLKSFADITYDKGDITVTYSAKKGGAIQSIRSTVKKDTTMHFDFMPKVYEIVNGDINPPRINNPKGCNKKQFSKYCDINSAFPTMLHFCDMPAAGYIYEEYDSDLLNFYIYEGDVVTNGSLITEDLAKRLGNSRYVFSTSKQIGCELGHYTYRECMTSSDKKDKIRKNFKWGIMYRGYYARTVVVKDGCQCLRYVKNKRDNLQLVACCVWSALCCVMLDAIKSINAKEFMVATDGLYYNGPVDPILPDWCKYRIEDKDMERLCGKGDEKYSNITYKNYDDLPSDADLKKARDRERKRLKRAAEKAELEKMRNSN